MSISSHQEKSSNFSQTCNLLSQYLKEKGSFGDLSLGLTQNLEGRNASSSSSMACLEVKPMDLFPQHTGFGPSPSMESLPKKANFRSPPKDPEAAQMTIFYAGKVLVFDDFPAKKAKEIMFLASKGSSRNSSSPNDIVSDTTSPFQNNSYEPIVTNLPIARNASVHRFLEKRKDRITSKAPYQLTSSSVSATAAGSKAPQANKMDERKTWLGLALEPKQQFGFQR